MQTRERVQKKRGHYFYNVIDIPYSKKFNISPKAINDIRGMAIFRKMDQQKICVHITERINKGFYLSPKAIRRHGKGLLELRESILKFILRCSPEDFAEITHLTKYDWDYIGPDKAIPSREDYLLLPAEKPPAVS